MRLNRLDLTRYGRFQDAQIVLPAPPAGAADVTVVYGPNEAGKSTAFHAYLELLFGMKPRDHPYEFRFKRSDLLVGAALDIPHHGPVTLQRNSKRTQSLLDDQGRPVADTFLSAALHGLDRDNYVERFSLNDEGLRKGGARIAGAQGDLGQLLHAGVSGLTTIATTLDQMTARADQFHKKGGRGTDLKKAKDRLAEIGQQLRAAHLTPDRASALAATRDKAHTVFTDADRALADARRREAASNAAQIWHDRTQDIADIDAQLTEFPDGPDLRTGAPEAIARLVATLSEKSQQASDADIAVAQAANEIAENPADPLADAIASELDQFDQLQIDGAPLWARAATAASDLGKRISERDALRDDINGILTRLDLGCTAITITAQELEDLAKAAQHVVNAQGDLTRAKEAVDRAKDQQSSAPAEPQDLSQLQSTWDAWLALPDISAAETTLANETARLKTAASGLPATWAALVDAGLPARDTLNDLVGDLATNNADIAAAQSELAKCDAALGIAQAKHRADAATSATVDAAATAQARRARDAKWVAHRDALSADTAAAFETAMHSDDDTQASFAAGTDARAQLATARRDAAAATAARDTAQSRLDDLTQSHDALVQTAPRLAVALGLAPDTRPSAFADRHAALLQAAEIAAAVDNARADFDAQNNRRLTAQAALAAAAKTVGVNYADSDLTSRVQAALTLQDSARADWQRWTDAQTAMTDLETQAADAAAQTHTAKQTLDSLTNTLPLAGRSATQIITALPDLRILRDLQQKHSDLVSRAAALERAIAQLDACAARISALGLQPDDPQANALAIIEQARKRVASAKTATARRAAAQAEHAKQTTQRQRADDAMTKAQDELADWFKEQGAPDLDPTARITLLVQRDGLRHTRHTHTAARLSAKAAVNPDLFDAELALLPDATRAAAVQQLLTDAQDARDLAFGAHRDAIRLHQDAFDADDSSDLATEKATILEELRAAARQAAVARLGVLAAKGALRRLASERRTTMLRDVEDAFVAITHPKWRSVDVWSQTEGEKLVGIQPDGSAVPVQDMSTGTMGQLYFALRVAGYRSFARDLGPLPMILDDIMETFDDGRAKAALHLCADIGRSGQAIIFTHHAHLIDLARNTIPDVNIVDMPR